MAWADVLKAQGLQALENCTRGRRDRYATSHAGTGRPHPCTRPQQESVAILIRPATPIRIQFYNRHEIVARRDYASKILSIVLGGLANFIRRCTNTMKVTEAARIDRNLTRLARNSRSMQGQQCFKGWEALAGCALITGGCGTVVGLRYAAHNLKFDSLLLSSEAIYNVLTGMHGISIGLGQTALGLFQVLGFAVLGAILVLAVLAVVSGSIRLGTNTLPQLKLIWNLLASALQFALKILAVPLGGLNGCSPFRTRHQPMASDTHRHQ
jgi:hypothetical protein